MELINLTKCCSKCNSILDLHQFYKGNNVCKICFNIRGREYNILNKDKRNKHCRDYYKKNKNKILEQSKHYYKNNIDKIKEYREKNKDKIKITKKLYNLKNKDKIEKYKKEYKVKNKDKIKATRKLYNSKNKSNRNADRRERLKTDINYKLLCNLRVRIYHALKRNSKSASTIELLGCTISELKTYLESKFKEGMTWENHNFEGWHIDHIIPCSSFDLSKPEEQRKCFHYTNLQPLWAEENLIKGDRIIQNQTENLTKEFYG